MDTCPPSLLAVNVIQILIDDNGNSHHHELPCWYNIPFVRQHEDNVADEEHQERDESD